MGANLGNHFLIGNIMPTQVDIEQLEGGTVIMKCSFFDGNDNAVTPNTLTYSLKDISGSIINTKDTVSITPDTVVHVALSGDDLPYGRVYFELNGEYDSTYGTGLKLHDYAQIDLMEAP